MQVTPPPELWVNLKAKDIHFLDVSEKETIFLVGAWLFNMNQNFF